MKKKILPKIIKTLLLLLILAGAGYYIYQKMHPVKEEAMISTASAMVGDVETVITGTGTLNPANQYEVKSFVKGKVLQAEFEESDLITQGDILYQISTSEITNALKSASLNLQKAKQAYRDLEEKQKALTFTSAYSGYVKKLYVKKGDKITTGTNLADIYNNDTQYLDVLFPANEVSEAWIGKKALVTMDSNDESLRGKITGISAMTEASTGGILGKKVTIQLLNASGISSAATANATVTGIVSISSGTFRPETSATIVATADGIIESLNLTEGAWVDRASTILTLSSSDLEHQLRDAKVSIEEAKLSLRSQKTQKELYTILSPISGTVISKNKKLGDTIDPSVDNQSGSMATIYDLSYLTFQLNIDELQISNIKTGQKVVIKSDAFPDASYEGTIERISLKGTTNNGITSYPVIVRMDQYGDLLPGMNVSGRIILNHASQVLTIPSSALQRGNLVYVQDSSSSSDSKSIEASQLDDNGNPIPDGFHAVTVEIGLNDGSNVEIKSGLTEGDIVYLPFDPIVESTFTFY